MTDEVDDLQGPRVLASISNAIVRVHARRYGRGPTRARTHVCADFLACMLRDPFTVGERTLIAAGHEEEVRRQRLVFYDTVEKELRLTVENFIREPVLAVLPQVGFRPEVATLIFLLEREGVPSRHGRAGDGCSS